MRGIIVPRESKDLLLEAFHQHEQHRVDLAVTKRQGLAIARWQRYVVGLRVRARIEKEFAKDVETAKEKMNDDNQMSEDRGTKRVDINAADKEAFDTGGGFLLD